MRFTNLQAGAGRLREAVDDFSIAWQNASEHWEDERQRELQKELVDRLLSEVQFAMHAVSQASSVLQTAVRDLEEN